MESRSSKALQQAIAQILEEDELPPDLLAQVETLLQPHNEADDLYRWTMKLVPHLRSKDVKVIGRLLQNASEVLNDEGQIDGETAATLPADTRRTIRQLSQNDGDMSGPATYVLCSDVVTRAYNRTHDSEAPTEG